MIKGGILVLLLALCFAGYSQEKEVKSERGKISGRVIDSATAKNIDYATVSVFAAGKDNAVSGATTNQKGLFTVDNLPAGTYTVVVDFIGYTKKTIQNVTITNAAPVFGAGTIFLNKSVAVLQGVTVTTQAKLIENRIDKMVFNAEKDITSQTGVATDVLKKVPQISVDVDGNVELAGSTSIKFLINGKPSSAFGTNIADVLQSIPASQIKSIEVITNPGAKYDAEGLGGIINIILKQTKVKGINGNLSLTGGTRLQNGSFNFNARNGNFAVNAFASGNATLRSTTVNNSTRLSSDTADKTNVSLQQDGNSQFMRHGFESGMGFDWDINKKNSLSGSVGYDNFGGSGNGLINQLQVTTGDYGAGAILSNIASLNHKDNAFHFHNIDANLSYKKTFDKEDQELEVEINSSFGNSRNVADNYQSLLPQDSVVYGISSINPGKQNETEIQADYTQPLSKEVKLGLGGKFRARDISSTSDVLSLQQDTKTYMTDNYLSNNLTYHEKVYAFYSEINFPVSTWFDAKIGGRYERTDINSYFSNAQQQVKIPGYNTFVPSVFFMKKLPNNQTLKLSYSKRIERPDYRDLNPFVNASDPKNISEGNPLLLPEIGNRYELSYNRDLGSTGSFMITAFYRTSNHDIQPYIVYYPSFKVGDSTYTNVSVSSSQNIGLEKNMGVNLFADMHLTTKLTLRGNVFMFYRHTINALAPGQNSHSFNYRMNMNASYQFSGTLAAEFFGNFSSARHEVQGKYPSFTSYSLAIRKQFWNKKGSLALTANNIFSEYVNQRIEVFGPGFSTSSLRRVPFRSIGINFAWKFGKLEFKKDKDDNKDGGNAAPVPEG